MAIVDCFPFFAPYGEELLYLRVNLLKDHVDKFIIVESNKTHSGKPVERKFMEIARKLGLPIEKIHYVEHDIPETKDLQILEIDKRNAGVNANNTESLYARVRERLQKDAVMMAMQDFQPDDVFIYGDADEIINPQHIKWVAGLAKNNPGILVKIPLVYLQGRADLRIHHRNGAPVVWWKAMFFATKQKIMENKISNMRCGNVSMPVQHPRHNGEVIQDMGWHFAWMGNKDQRQTKADSFAHAYDSFKWMDTGEGYSDYKKFVDTTAPIEGNVAPDGNKDHVLKRYPHSSLPKLIFEKQWIKDFLLPEVKLDEPFAFNDCHCYWCQKLEFPLMYQLDKEGKQTWFEIPRSCSVTMKESFPDRQQVLRSTKLYKDLAKRSKPIVVWTDPVDRFISLINVFVVPKQRYWDYGDNLFQSFDVKLEDCTKQEKIDYFFANMNKINSFHQVHHFHPQCRFVDTDNFKEFTIIKRENLNKELNIDLHYNATEKEITKEDLTKEQIEFIKRAYASDYEFIKKYGKE